jgi:hypothetical protein
MEKKRELVSREAHEAVLDQMAGLVLTKLSGWPARIASADLGCDGELKPCCVSCAPRLPKPAPSWQMNRVSRRSTNDERERAHSDLLQI